MTNNITYDNIVNIRRNQQILSKWGVRMKFKSKVDLWWYALIVIFIGVSIYTFSSDSPTNISVGCILLITAILFLIPPMFYSYCIVDSDFVTIRTGLFYKKIPVTGIVDIYKVDSLLSSAFATSFVRVGVRYTRRNSSRIITEHISPKEREKFIKAVNSLKNI